MSRHRRGEIKFTGSWLPFNVLTIIALYDLFWKRTAELKRRIKNLTTFPANTFVQKKDNLYMDQAPLQEMVSFRRDDCRRSRDVIEGNEVFRTKSRSRAPVSRLFTHSL
jgi:hypothetical protein